MKDNLGMGVMIGMLGGNEETVKAVQGAIGKTIKSLTLVDDNCRIEFTDDTGIRLYDDGQSCCESRYMKTDDDLSRATGQKLVSIELRDGGDVRDDGESHEIQFLDIVTDKDRYQFSNHNEHNGYYGGFYLVAREI